MQSQDNPIYRSIYDLLLLAGYFRIRIASLKPFDKILGGLAWSITNSNFQVNIYYKYLKVISDQMKIGQKIRISEQICNSLKKMKCPHSLQPFQLQGLDVKSIYPVLQWLINFVYQTRQYRQKYNAQISNFLTKNLLSKQESKLPIPIRQQTRLTKNLDIKHLPRNHPIRVYSALIQFGDLTSHKTYNKLMQITEGKINLCKDKGNSKQKQKKISIQNGQIEIQNLLFNDEKEQKQNKIIFAKLKRRNSFAAQHLQNLVNQNHQQISQSLQKPSQSEQQNLLQIQSNLKSNLEELKKVINNIQKQNQAIQAQVQKTQNKVLILDEKIIEQKKKVKEYQEIKVQIIHQMKAKSAQKIKQLDSLAQKRNQIKTKRNQIKKKVNAEINKLQVQIKKATDQVPQIDEQVYQQMQSQYKRKKKIYDQRFRLLAQINQQVAVLQRKAEAFPNTTQIGQYHQRFLQLFQSINIQIEKKRGNNNQPDTYDQINSLEQMKKMILNFIEVKRTFKNNYQENIKDKKGKKQFAQNLEQVNTGIQKNLQQVETMLQKIKKRAQQQQTKLQTLIREQREYYSLLKNLQLQYAKIDYLQSLLQ